MVQGFNKKGKLTEKLIIEASTKDRAVEKAEFRVKLSEVSYYIVLTMSNEE